MPAHSFFRTVPGLILVVVTLVLGASLPIALGLEETSALGLTALAFSAVVLFIGAPFCLIRFVFKESLHEYGWRLPHKPQEAFFLSAGVLAFLSIPIVLLSGRPEFRAFYDLGAISSEVLFLFFPLSVVYFVAEEFLFRGFFFCALRKRIPAWAITIDAITFGLLHFDKPPLEMAFAMGVAALLSWLTLRTGSFLPAAGVHFVMAVVLSLIVTFT